MRAAWRARLSLVACKLNIAFAQCHAPPSPPPKKTKNGGGYRPDLLAAWLHGATERQHRRALVLGPADQQMLPLSAAATAAAFRFPVSVAAGSAGRAAAALDLIPGSMSPAETVAILLKSLPH